jgi:hypothetical protein
LEPPRNLPFGGRRLKARQPCSSPFGPIGGGHKLPADLSSSAYLQILR